MLAFDPIFREFVEIWIAQYLYVREMYPNDAYGVRERFYNRSIHPLREQDVVKYVASLTNELCTLIDARPGAVIKFVMVLYDADKNVCLERLVCDLQFTQKLKDTKIDASQLENLLCALDQLSRIDLSLAVPSADNKKWRVLMHVNDPKPSSYWSSLDPKAVSIIPQEVVMLPLKSMRTADFAMEMYVETSRHNSR